MKPTNFFTCISIQSESNTHFQLIKYVDNNEIQIPMVAPFDLAELANTLNLHQFEIIANCKHKIVEGNFSETQAEKQINQELKLFHKNMPKLLSKLFGDYLKIEKPKDFPVENF